MMTKVSVVQRWPEKVVAAVDQQQLKKIIRDETLVIITIPFDLLPCSAGYTNTAWWVVLKKCESFMNF